MNRLEGNIFEKIHTIREVIDDEDRWVAEEIAMKKQNSTELSNLKKYLVYPKYDKKLCYYQEFWKVYLINEIMISKIKEYSVANKTLTKEIGDLEVLCILIVVNRERVVTNMESENQEKSQETLSFDCEKL